MSTPRRIALHKLCVKYRPLVARGLGGRALHDRLEDEVMDIGEEHPVRLLPHERAAVVSYCYVQDSRTLTAHDMYKV